MFEILFLGTSASAPSAKRGLSAQIVKHDEYRFLIDCGEGTQRQILQSGIGFKQLTRILLTHGHLDHILGLGGLMSTFMRWEAIEELEIFGGKSALERVRALINEVVLRGANPPMVLHYREIGPGVLFETDDFTVTAFPVTHRGPDCLGYMFEEKARRPFLPEKATELGVASLAPLALERSVSGGDALSAAKRRRWTARCIAAAKQSGADFLPAIEDPLSLQDFLAGAIGGIGLYGDLSASTVPVAAALRDRAGQAGAYYIVVGPEGGLTDAERQALDGAGFGAVRLGRTILRVETAAVALVSAVLALQE